MFCEEKCLNLTLQTCELRKLACRNSVGMAFHTLGPVTLNACCPTHFYPTSCRRWWVSTWRRRLSRWCMVNNSSKKEEAKSCKQLRNCASALSLSSGMCGSKVINSCKSSAYLWYLIPWRLQIRCSGVVSNINITGPSTDPWGTP